MTCILVILDYPNFVAHCYLPCIEFLLLPNLPDEDARELVMVTHSAMMAPSSLILGCWNLHCFRTAQIYFEFLIDQFDILAISEHCLFQEQVGILKSS